MPEPRGVNDSVLGTAEEFKVEGPGRVCLNEFGFDLMAGETSYLGYLGFHNGQLRIRGVFGEMTLSESDIFADRRRRGSPVALDGRKVLRSSSGGKISYAVYGRSAAYGGEERLLMVVDGLHGNANDVVVLRRITSVETGAPCTRRFVYGFFFDDEK